MQQVPPNSSLAAVTADACHRLCGVIVVFVVEKNKEQEKKEQTTYLLLCFGMSGTVLGPLPRTRSGP